MLRVEAFHRLAEPPGQEDFRPVVAAERSIGAERLVIGVDVLPAEFLEQLDGGLLDELRPRCTGRGGVTRLSPAPRYQGRRRRSPRR